MHSELLHDNIVRLYCAWKDSEYIHVAEEYAPHGDIYSLLKPRNAMHPVGVPEQFVVTKVRSWPLLGTLLGHCWALCAPCGSRIALHSHSLQQFCIVLHVLDTSAALCQTTSPR
jgi:hypothetical protein